MNPGFTSVPFKTETAHGFTTVHGVAKFSPAGIVLEFESKILGLVPNGVKEVRLPIAEILDVSFKKGVFRRSAKIEIRTRTYAVLAELPASEGKLSLKLIKDDIGRGEAAVAQLQKELYGYQDTLPPPHTPVSQLFEDESEEETKPLK